MRGFLRNFFEGGKQVPEEKEKPQQPPGVIEHTRSPEQKRRKSPVEAPEESVLENYEKKKSKPLSGGSSKVIFVELKDDGSGVFKPKSGERPSFCKPGTCFSRERAAYLVDRFLGFDLVPPTVIREVDGEIGSMQQFIPDSETGWEIARNKLEVDILQQQLIRLRIFDYIICNADRHGGNFLIKSEENKIYAIDNELSFDNVHYPSFYDCAKFFDVPIPQEITEGIEKFLSWKEGRAICEDLLGELLSPEEVGACMKRIEKINDIIKKHGTIPESTWEELIF